MKFVDQCLELLGGGSVVGARKDECLTICPRCRKKKFYFNFFTGRSQCKGGDCGIKFNSIFALERYITSTAYKPYLCGMASTQGQIDVWRGETEDAKPAYDVTLTRNYLKKRHISKKVSIRENFWGMQRSGTLIVPLHNFFSGGTTPYYRFLQGPLRWVGEGGFERVHHCFIGASLLQKVQFRIEVRPSTFKLPVVVVAEGIFDILTPKLSNWGIATLGAEYSVFLMAFLKNTFAEIWHLPDNDKAGEASVKKLKALCKTYDIPYRCIDHVYNDYPKAKDPGELPVDTHSMLVLRQELTQIYA